MINEMHQYQRVIINQHTAKTSESVMNIDDELDSDSFEYPRSCFSIARRHNRTRGKRGRPPKNKYINNIDYSSSVFPPQEHRYQDQSYESVSVIKKLIEILNDTNPYAFVYQSENILIFKCKRRKGCKSEITFQLDPEQNVYRIVKLVNSHNHSLKQTKQEEKQAFKYLEDNKILFVTKNQHQQLLNDKFGMNSRRFLYLQWKYNKRCRMLYKELLQQQNCAFYCHFVDDNEDNLLNKNKPQRNQFPDILLYWTPKMSQLYQQYCDTLHFYHVPALFNFKSHQSVSRWGIGLISGLNKSATFIVFAVCIYDTSFDHPSLYENIFDIFLNQMNKKPQTIVTDYNQNTLKALENMKSRQSGAFNFEVMINGVEFLKQCAQVLKKHINSQQQMDRAKTQILKIKLAILSRSQKQINQIVSPMYEDHDKQLIQLLQKNQNKVFAKFLPKLFYGLTLFNVIDEDISQLVKKDVMKQTSFIQIFQRINDINNNNHFENPQSFLPSSKNRNCLKVLSENNQQTSERFSPYQFKKMMSEDQYYFQVFSVLPIKIFKVFYNQYEASSRYLNKSIEHQNDCYKISQQITVENNTCSCSFSRQTGIPCSHELVVLRLTCRRYLEFINKRWCIYGKQYQKHLNVIRKAESVEERFSIQKEKAGMQLSQRSRLQQFGLSKVSEANRDLFKQGQPKQIITSNSQETKSKRVQNRENFHNASQAINQNTQNWQKDQKCVPKNQVLRKSGMNSDQAQKSFKSKQYQSLEQSSVVQQCPTCGQSIKTLGQKDQQNEWSNTHEPKYVPNPYFYPGPQYYYPTSENNQKSMRQRFQRSKPFQRISRNFSPSYQQPFYPAFQFRNPYYNAPMIPNPRFFQRQYGSYPQYPNYYQRFQNRHVALNARNMHKNHQFQINQNQAEGYMASHGQMNNFIQQNTNRKTANYQREIPQINYQQGKQNIQNNYGFDRNVFSMEKTEFPQKYFKQAKLIDGKNNAKEQLSHLINSNKDFLKYGRAQQPQQAQQQWGFQG